MTPDTTTPAANDAAGSESIPTPTASATPEALPSPEHAQKRMIEFMGKVLSDIGRLDQSVQYLASAHNGLSGDLKDHLEYLQQCIAELYHHNGLEMPKRLPKLLDAQVTILGLDSTTPADPEAPMWVALSEKKHPVFGYVQILVKGGDGDENKLLGLQQLQPILGSRLAEALDAARSQKGFKYDEFYSLAVNFIHAEPIGPESRPYHEGQPVSAEETTDE